MHLDGYSSIKLAVNYRAKPLPFQSNFFTMWFFMNNKIKLLTLFLFFFSINAFSQKTETEKKFSLNAGYGLAGGFFASSYEDHQLGSIEYLNKNFVGTNLFVEVEMKLKRNNSLALHYSRQIFSKAVFYENSVGINHVIIDTKIRDVNNIIGLSFNKFFTKNKNSLSVGVGPYYLAPLTGKVFIAENSTGITVIVEESDPKDSYSAEAGAFVDFSYNYQFQPRVEIGVKSQFYYTISGNYAESITLFPYVKIKF